MICNLPPEKSPHTEALGYKNPNEALREHCKGVSEILTPTAGGRQNMKYITEADVYRLVMRSKLPEAEQFQDWVCEEVLPRIRKTGGRYKKTSQRNVEMSGSAYGTRTRVPGVRGRYPNR